MPGKLRTSDAGFRGLLLSQALGVFNDNAFKTLLALAAVAAMPPDRASRLIAAAGALFILPFILFSSLAGALTDRYGKRDLILFYKAIEVVLMAFTFPALLYFNVPVLLGLLALLGIHSALLSPVKLAILPEMIEDSGLSHANGLVQTASFAGILLGTMAAGLLVGHPRWAAVTFVAAAGAGLAASLLVPKLPPAGSREPFRLNFLAQTWGNLLEIRRSRGVYLALVGSAYFWFLGAAFQMNILVYGKEMMGVGEGWLSALQAAVAVGIASGSFAAGCLSAGRVELGLVPAGALGLVVFSLDLAFSFRCEWRTLADLFLLGASGGCFVVPLQAFVQQRSPEAERGKVIATGNVLSFVGVLLSSLFLWAFTSVFRLHAAQVFLVFSLMTAVVAAYIIRTLPDALIRLVFYPLAHMVYSIRVEGADRIPLKGPALLVANHVSYADAAIIFAASQRPVRFLMLRQFYDAPVVGYFFRVMGCIPISGSDSPREMVRSIVDARTSLARGELVCIFAEGEITRLGQMLRFKKGLERIVRGLEAPVLPVHLDRVWGSIFSFARGRFFFKWPRRLPYPVTVSFGVPLRAGCTTHEVRQAILGLGAEAFRHRLDEGRALPIAFLREAKRHPSRHAITDSTGADMTWGGALVKSYLLGRHLLRMIPEKGNNSTDDDLPDGSAVGVLLPPTAAAALANYGLSLMGKVPVNLNYTSSPDLVRQCAARAGASAIVTSRKFLEKLGWQASAEMVFVEDAAARIGGFEAALTAACMLGLPCFLVERFFGRRGLRPLESLATVMFTSGSTGVPKGVKLTHANILSNIEAMGQLFEPTRRDRMLGVLPFFHSFGFTGSLWFPPLGGFGVVYHHNPLEAKRIGELVERHGVTLLLGTPTFLLAYMRRIGPEQLRSLRAVIVGAEKLRESVAQAFRERFGKLPLEGYGCTELSPVAAVNIPDFESDGMRQRGMKPGTIGHPLPGVLMKIVHPETGETLPPGQAGLLLVKGPNVMKGYLADAQKTAEVLREGYYVTGDVASIDEDGFVTLTDRLSRFSKVGGEMVPHIKVEEKLHELSGSVDHCFVVSAVEDPGRGERLVVLYKGDHDVEGLCKGLGEALPKLWVPDRGGFHRVTEFPMLGSGKLDMQRVKAMAKELEPRD
ncbi:MAG: acyl-[ACP]--phospholipid O-acyltransferase [Elusimicrobiota bacterium]